MSNWKKEFTDFFNHPWSESAEVYFLEAIKEFKNQILKNEQAGKEYLGRMFKSNGQTIQKSCSEQFKKALNNLIGEQQQAAPEAEKSETPNEGPNAEEEQNVDSIESEADAEEQGTEDTNTNTEEKPKEQKNESLMKNKKILKEMAELVRFKNELPKVLNTNWQGENDMEFINAIKVHEDKILANPEKGFEYVRKMRHANSQFLRNCSQDLRQAIDAVLSEEDDLNGFDKDYNLWEGKELIKEASAKKAWELLSPKQKQYYIKAILGIKNKNDKANVLGGLFETLNDLDDGYYTGGGSVLGSGSSINKIVDILYRGIKSGKLKEANEPKGSKTTKVKGDFSSKSSVSANTKPTKVEDKLDKGGSKVKAKVDFDNNSDILGKSDAKLPIGNNNELLSLLKEMGADESILKEFYDTDKFQWPPTKDAIRYFRSYAKNKGVKSAALVAIERYKEIEDEQLAELLNISREEAADAIADASFLVEGSLNEWTQEELYNMRRMNNPGMGVKRTTKPPKVKSPRQKRDMNAYISKWLEMLQDVRDEFANVMSDQELEVGELLGGTDEFEASGRHNEYGDKLNKLETKFNKILSKIQKYVPGYQASVYDKTTSFMNESTNMTENYLYFPTKTYKYLVQADTTFNPYSASTYPKMYFSSEETAKQYVENNTKKGDLQYKGKVNESFLNESLNEPFDDFDTQVTPEEFPEEKTLNIEEDRCPVCHKHITRETSDISGICNSCTDKGWWMDPSGGIHDPDDDDPAAMYESMYDDDDDDDEIDEVEFKKKLKSKLSKAKKLNKLPVVLKFLKKNYEIELTSVKDILNGDFDALTDEFQEILTSLDKLNSKFKLTEGFGDEEAVFPDDTDWDYDGLSQETQKVPKDTRSAYEKYKESHPELNWNEAENEISDDDLAAASDYYDRQRQSTNEEESNYGPMRESSMDDYEEFEAQEREQYGEICRGCNERKEDVVERYDAYNISTGYWCDDCYENHYPYRKDNYYDPSYAGERMEMDEAAVAEPKQKFTSDTVITWVETNYPDLVESADWDTLEEKVQAAWPKLSATAVVQYFMDKDPWKEDWWDDDLSEKL